MSKRFEVDIKNLPVPNLNREDLLAAMTYRYACKKFDPTKKISQDDWNAILQAGQLSPTSLGFEPFKILDVENKEIREKIRPYGWGIQAGLEADKFIVYIARKRSELKVDSDYIQHIWNDIKELPQEVKDTYTKFYDTFANKEFKTFESERAAFDWTCKQTYIVLANMLTMAAYEGVDSVALEGYNPDEMNRILGTELGLFDTDKFGVAVMAAFGYRGEQPHREKTRRNMDEIVEVIK